MSKKVVEQKKEFKTRAGIPLKRVYTPDDVKDLDYYRDVAVPGQYPYVRGPYSDMYRTYFWMIRQVLGYGTPEDTAKRLEDMAALGGQTAYSGERAMTFSYDAPTNYGIDSDNPNVRHQVGKTGVAIDSYEDFVDIMKTQPVEHIAFGNHDINGPTYVILAMYTVGMEKLGVSQAKLRGSTKNDPFHCFNAERIGLLPIEAEVRIALDVLEYCLGRMPRWSPISIASYSYASAGFNSIQELGIALAHGMAFVEGGIQRGLDPNEVASSITFFTSVGISLLEEIAKFRAARRLWAKLLKERYGVNKEKALRFRTYALTLPAFLTAQQPLVNVIRGTIQGLAAVLGGVQALGITPYDEALAIPTMGSELLAIRTHQVIAEESDVASTVDPLGGSYCIEALTNELEQRVMEQLNEIGALGRGGMLNALIAGTRSGYFTREIDKAFLQRQKDIASGETTVIGVNKYVTDEYAYPEVFKVPPEYEEEKIKKLKRFREERDETVWREGLERLRKCAQSDENIMNGLMAAVERKATLEEIMNVLADVFGESELRKKYRRARY